MIGFDTKLRLTVYAHSDLCPLHHNELMVFSYLLFQDRYQTYPTYTVTAAKVGLHEKAVSDICDRLKGYGILSEDRRPSLNSGQLGWFREKNPTGPHISQRLAYRVTFVRDVRADNPLSANAISVYSYVHSLTLSKWKPKNITKAYIAAVLKLDVATVGESLRLLKDNKFLTVEEDPLLIGFKEPSASQMRCFADWREIREEKKSGGIFVVEAEVAPVQEKKYDNPVEQMAAYYDDYLRQHFGGDYEDFIQSVVDALKARNEAKPEAEWPRQAAKLARAIEGAVEKKRRASEGERLA